VMGALSDLSVIDISTMIAGSTVSMLLADLGADVIKVEHLAAIRSGTSVTSARAGPCCGRCSDATSAA